IIQTHFEQGRRLLEQFGGYEVKTIGDSLMVAFRTAVAALDFALGLHRETGDERVKIRAGIHIGPVTIRDEDASGAMVNYAARIVAMVRPPEVWVSDEAKKHIE